MRTTRFYSFAFAGLGMLAALPAFATAITASATGDVPALAIRVPAPGSVTSGDFTYQQAIAPGTVGDGEDDGITWSFNFTGDPGYSAFAGPIVQANFALTLIPRNDLVSSDAFSINVSGLSPSVVPDIPPLSLNVAHTLNFDLLDFYTSAQLLGVLSSRGGRHPHAIQRRCACHARASRARLRARAGDAGAPRYRARWPGLRPSQAGEHARMVSVIVALGLANSGGKR
jgi:hypothetical protein